MPVIKSPTEVRSNIYKLIDHVNRDSKPVFINGKSSKKSAVLISQKDYDAEKETMALLLNGQIEDALKREQEPKKNEVDAFKMLRDIKNGK